MTFFGALAGLLWSFWFIVAGALLRWILRSGGGQLFHGAFVIGDICLWIALGIIVIAALFGLVGDAALFSGSRSRRRGW